MTIDVFGTLCFGLVIGWVTYRTLRRQREAVAISNIASVIAAIGGGAVVTLFKTPELLGWYSVGLAVGFFGYLFFGLVIFPKSDWLGDGP